VKVAIFSINDTFERFKSSSVPESSSVQQELFSKKTFRNICLITIFKKHHSVISQSLHR